MIKCLYYRKVISRSADEGAPLAPAAEAHVAECPRCRRFCEMELGLVRRLSAGTAAQNRQSPPPFLHRRIMARITTAESGPRRAPQGLLLRRVAALATSVILLAAVFLWPGRIGTKSASDRVATVRPSPAVTTAAAPDWPQAALLAAWATNLDKPLETEAHSVVHDARGAVTALADAYFPETLRQTLLAGSTSPN